MILRQIRLEWVSDPLWPWGVIQMWWNPQKILASPSAHHEPVIAPARENLHWIPRLSSASGGAACITTFHPESVCYSGHPQTARMADGDWREAGDGLPPVGWCHVSRAESLATAQATGSAIASDTSGAQVGPGADPGVDCLRCSCSVPKKDLSPVP